MELKVSRVQQPPIERNLFRIHSIELKVDLRGKGVVGLGSENPFNGIESNTLAYIPPSLDYSESIQWN